MKKINMLMLSLLVFSLIGCGGDNSSTKSIKQNPNVGKIDNSFVASPHLQKIGEDGEILNAGTSSWKAVEIIETGLMFETKTLVNSLNSYTHDEALNYCENLQLAGFDDWRLPTSKELYTIFKVAINSSAENKYFVDYFKDTIYTVNRYCYDCTLTYSIWTSTSVESPDSDLNNSYYFARRVNMKNSSIFRDRNIDSASIRTWCVRQ